ncbi:hypothetical protein FSP39_022079, partial [Pinctada imbricata]
AFFAVKSHSETALADHTIVFDKAILNRGSTYNAYTGTFVAPQTGVYFLSWTIYSSAHSYISTRLMVNGKQISVMFSDSEEIHDYHSSTGVAILELNIVAFFAVKSHSETALADHTIVFDKAIVNRGSAYNAFTGTFVTPKTGVYFFSWTIYSAAHSYISTRLMVNGKQMSVMFSDSENIAAFFAVKSNGETALADHTILFDKDIVNKGFAYNRYMGTFIAPRAGIYFFSWTIHSYVRSFISTRLMVNGKQMSAIFSDSEEVGDYHSATGVAILDLNIGDAIYIKSHPTHGQKGSILCTDFASCTFSGYVIN